MTTADRPGSERARPVLRKVRITSQWIALVLAGALVVAPWTGPAESSFGWTCSVFGAAFLAAGGVVATGLLSTAKVRPEARAVPIALATTALVQCVAAAWIVTDTVESGEPGGPTGVFLVFAAVAVMTVALAAVLVAICAAPSSGTPA